MQRWQEVKTTTVKQHNIQHRQKVTFKKRKKKMHQGQEINKYDKLCATPTRHEQTKKEEEK